MFAYSTKSKKQSCGLFCGRLERSESPMDHQNVLIRLWVRTFCLRKPSEYPRPPFDGHSLMHEDSVAKQRSWITRNTKQFLLFGIFTIHCVAQ